MKDKYGRKIDYLRISLTDRCNLRCIYCMEDKDNTFFNDKELLTNDEVCKVVKACSKLGIKKIRLTGGEPLVRKDIVELVEEINKIEGIEEIYITTNGILLEDKVSRLKNAGLKGVNISLDSLKAEMFNRLTRLGDLKKVLSAIDKCLEYGIKVKINTVMIKGMNEVEILDFVNLTLEKNIDVRFIELMPIGVGSKFKGVSNEEIIKLINKNYKDIEEVRRNESGGPATYIRVNHGIGKVGFISAISNCFCEECNRIRLTSEGFLKQCLHYNYGVDLKKLLRGGASEDEISKVIMDNIYNKPEKHLFMKKSEGKELKFMNQIGG
ncbi:GTP 3',8-cyclase MoaA [Clostridium sp. AL.422]|uniref:GTP 3',8-cyclase MoaA n=1 Tax=Clostridium TaxID=1485 RepID=UPI00293DE449|nr:MULTISPECIES: GTP 3',8-cyclase MoaA [unclassified Clostridium]MDV4150600.1 GTP 3',8-cyclase MoaA [Clostridium sp. AL.422]